MLLYVMITLFRQFPEICKAIDEFLSIGEYKSKIFYGNDGIKERGYVYMVKNFNIFLIFIYYE